jgi:uncharacterized protein YcbX
MSVATIRRYPVKSMLGEELFFATITVRGIPGDRALALLDRASGKVASAKHPRRWRRLLDCRAAVVAPDHDPATIAITLPDERTMLSTDPAIDPTLSDLFEREVTLTATPPETAETEREYPEVEGLPVSGMFFSGPIGLGAPPGTFFDYAPIHLLTTATLAHLRAVAPTGDFDLRRFRPNLVIDLPDTTGFAENDWVGRTLRIGNDVVLRITDPTPRCVIPTLPHGELPRDPGILRTIAAHNRPPIPTLGNVTWPCIGVYATVEQGGIVRQGDAVRVD